jgi:hypothetical protein
VFFIDMALTAAQNQQLIQALMGPKGGFRGQQEAVNEARIRGEAGFREFIGDPGTTAGTTFGAATGGAGFGDLSDIFAQQQQQTGEFLGRFGEKVAGFEPLTALQQRIGGELGVPQLRQQQVGLEQNLIDLESTLASLGGTIRQVPGQVQQQFAGRGTQEQIERLQAERALPFIEQRGRETERFGEQARIAQRGRTQLGQAEQTLAERLGLAVQEQQRQLQPLQLEAQFLGDRLAREITGFTQSMQNELTQLLAQQQQGFAASQAELDRAQQLAIAEQGFELERQRITQQQVTAGGVGAFNPFAPSPIQAAFTPEPKPPPPPQQTFQEQVRQINLTPTPGITGGLQPLFQSALNFFGL